MDNSWLGHCGSMWQSTSLPESHLQLQHTGQNFYPYISQDSVLLGNGIVQQCAHPWASNSTAENSSHAEFNGSFITFLSGPLPSLQGELQQLSKVSTTNEKLINCNNANGSASGNGPVLVPAAKLSQYFSSHKLKAGQTVKPTAVINPPKREMDRPAVYVGNEKLKHSAFPRGVADSAVDDNGMPDIVTSRKLFPDTGSFGQLSPPLSSYPRVFCLGTSGYLLLKNTGLLGVICLCHDSHLSVSRFCEHSGLSNVNPGNAVRMDSGVTIAQWRKVFFQKLGIKAPEDHAEWDWPEVSPVATGWGEFYPSLPNYSPTSQLLGGFRSSNGAGLSGNNVSVSKNPLNFQEDVDLLVHNVKQTSEFSGSSCSTSKSRLFHVTDMELKSCSYPQLVQGQENGSSFISAYIGSSSTDTNSLPDLTISESLGINSALMQMNTSSISSNIELSLGHPSQQSKKLGTLAQQAFEYHPIVKPLEYQQSFFPDLCMHKALESQAMEGSRSNFHVFDLSPKCGKDQLDLVNSSYGVYKATSESRTRNSVFPMLQAHFNGPSEGMLYSAATKSRADEPQSESLSLKRDQIDFGDNRQFNTDTSCVLGHVNGDKGVGEKNVNLRFATDSSRYNVNNSSVVKGIVHSNRSALQEKNLYSCKPCPDNWNNLNLCGKTSLISCNGPCDSGNVISFCKPMDSREAPLTQAVQLGFSLSSSTLIKHQALQSSNKETLEGRQFELTQNSRTQTLHHGFTDLGTHVQTIAPITDQLEGCNISPLLHAGSLRPQDSQLHCQHTTDVNAVHWPYVRHGGLESNITPSVEQAKCFLVAPSSFMSYHCSCSVQPGTSAETHHLIGEPPHSTQREQNRTSGCKKHNTFACMLEDDSHKFALNNVTFLDENSNLMGQKKNKLMCHSSQWRDVPKKANEAVSLTHKEQRATFLNMNEKKRGQKADAGGKKFYCDVAFRKVECPKEPEMSNVSSGGSGPVVTEASAQNNVVVDEGSGIDRCWSSNDAQGSEQSSDFFAGPSKTSRSLMDELRLRDSLRSKKLHNQFGFSIQEKNNCIQKVADISQKVIRKKTKWRQLDTAFTASACGYPGGTCGTGLQSHSCKGKGVPRLDYGSAEECAYCVEPSCRGRRRVRMHSLETLSCNSKINCNETKIIGSQSNPVKVGDDDNFETCELPRRKRLRSDTSSAFRHIDKGDDLGEEASAECSLVDSSSMFSEIHEKVRERAVRPIVCEKYGVICNGNQSKPVKFGSLRNICDSLAKCSSTITKTSSEKFRKVIAKGKCRRINKSLNLKKVGSCNAQRVTTAKNSIYSPEKRRYDCLMKTGTIADDSVPVQQKPKSKEIQIWGLYEPTLEGMLPTTRFSKGHFSDNKLVGKVDIHTGEEAPTCARTEGYKGRKKEGVQYNFPQRCGGGLVAQEQLNAWIHITGHKSSRKEVARLPPKDAEYDYRKEYARYKHSKGWKSLVVYKSGIHALGLYTARFISQGAMVVEYVGEIVGLRVADRREVEYLSGKKLQYKSACYFFRIDQEHIVDATQKGGIARFVNHSCLPNCVARIISVRNEKKVVFFAERDIYPGEEITYDYNFNHEDEGKKIPCYCNANKCRRYLN